jgi:hypothetical protein
MKQKERQLEHITYLHNLIKDDWFINMVKEEELEEYFIGYDKEEYDLEEYIETVETMFSKYNVEYISWFNLIEYFDIIDKIEQNYDKISMPYMWTK